VAEEEDDPGIGCPAVPEAVLAALGIHQPHLGEGRYIERHQGILGPTPAPGVWDFRVSVCIRLVHRAP
jgi:hypothetical protein